MDILIKKIKASLGQEQQYLIPQGQVAKSWVAVIKRAVKKV